MNSLKKLWVLGGVSLLVVAGAAIPLAVEDDFRDPIQYETPTPEVYHEALAEDDSDAQTSNVKKVILHYYNSDKKNNQRDIYVWTGNNGKAFEMKQDSDDTSGNYWHVELDFTGTEATYAGKPSLNFIVKYRDTWTGQSLDISLDYEEFPPNSSGLVEVWTAPGTAGSIDIYPTKADTIKAKLSEAYFTGWKKIHCVADEQREKPTKFRLYAYDKAYLVSNDAVQARTHELRLIKEGVPSSVDFDITFNHNAHVNVQYVVETEYASHEKVQSTIVTSYKLYDDTNFVKYYTYKENDLGCVYGNGKATFKVWAPTAGAIILNVYNKGTPKKISISGSTSTSDIKKSYFMTMQPGGVWEKTLIEDTAGSLNGKYYTYTVYNSEGVNEVCDPYAHACGVNGLRGMILDFNTTNPDGWNNLPLKWDGTERDIKTPQELSIYEIHIRDLTEDETWTGHERRGTFNAFSEAGTTYTGKNKNGNSTTVKTGFDHIEELGVNAIQIMPMFDHDNSEMRYYTKDNGEQVMVSSDYAGSEKTQIDFNWGYNPLNYNCIEGSYSTNPEDGAVRVKEFKKLVQAYANNANKTRVIMDVVYNHVSSVSNSNFSKLMPRYYFRFNETKDEYYDGSGCSNEVKSEAPMMSKFIVDSLCWWASEYKVKGFRFDLMGLIDLNTLAEARKRLYEIDPDIYIYGEGWKALGESGLKEEDGGFTWQVLYDDRAAEKNNSILLGCFNDAGRDHFRGGNDGGFGTGIRYPGYGFMSQGSGDIGGKQYTVGEMMTGKNSWKSAEGKGQNPKQSVNYVSCHDNFALYDQFSWTLNTVGHGDDAKTPMTPPATVDVVSAVAATQASVMLSNGVAFIQGGEELFRTKVEDNREASRVDEDYVVMYNNTAISHNSYKSSVKTNSFKWDRKICVKGYDGTTVDTKNYWKGIVDAIKVRQDIAKNNLFEGTSGRTSGGNCNYKANDNDTVVNVYIGGYIVFISGRKASAQADWWVKDTTSAAVASVGTCSLGSSSGGYKPVTLGMYSMAVFKA